MSGKRERALESFHEFLDKQDSQKNFFGEPSAVYVVPPETTARGAVEDIPDPRKYDICKTRHISNNRDWLAIERVMAWLRGISYR